jgi:hypothetical protein
MLQPAAVIPTADSAMMTAKSVSETVSVHHMCNLGIPSLRGSQRMMVARPISANSLIAPKKRNPEDGKRYPEYQICLAIEVMDTA